MTALYQRIWLTNMMYGILIGDSSSEGELCWEYEDDPEFIYDGASMDPSQPCDNVRGVSYTPPGWRRVYFKKKYIKHPSLDSPDSAGPAKKLKFD